MDQMSDLQLFGVIIRFEKRTPIFACVPSTDAALLGDVRLLFEQREQISIAEHHLESVLPLGLASDQATFGAAAAFNDDCRSRGFQEVASVTVVRCCVSSRQLDPSAVCVELAIMLGVRPLHACMWLVSPDDVDELIDALKKSKVETWPEGV